MKLRKFLSGFLFGLGCAVLFIGLAAMVLPLIQNDQLRLVLSSFEMPSRNPIVSFMNGLMTYALQNCYLVMLIGAGIAFVGASLLLFGRPAEPERPSKPSVPRPRPYAATAGAEAAPVWHASRAPEAKAKNPFADTSLADMLAPKASAGTEEENPFSAFAPIVQAKPVETQGPDKLVIRRPVGLTAADPSERFDVSPYARPASAPNPSIPEAPEVPPPAPTVAEALVSTPPASVLASPDASETAASTPAAAPEPAAQSTAMRAADTLRPESAAAALPAAGRSQSGSRMIIRSTFSAPDTREAPVETPAGAPVQTSPTPEESAPLTQPVQPAPRVTPSRIKSTMGKHS